MKPRLALILAVLGAVGTRAQDAPRLSLPERPPHALTGSEVAEAVSTSPLREREERLFTEIINGNVPNHLRRLEPISLTNGATLFTVFTTADYLSVGNDADYLRVPLTPMTAQRIADQLNCSLPTPALVDAIWHAAEVKLVPEPMPPGPEMITVPAFAQHQARIQRQLGNRAGLIAGPKKDLVGVDNLTNRVAIYGWHRTNGDPIQPLYTRHAATWVDYSHGIRLVSNQALSNGQPVSLAEAVPNLARYPTQWVGTAGNDHQTSVSIEATGIPKPTGHFGESETEFILQPEVRVRLNFPPPSPVPQKELLVIFALPNGNTIEQSAGRQPHNTNEWRYGIQHIAAQIRYVRAALPETRIGVAYLEAAGLSWPAWRKRNGNDAIPSLVSAVRQAYSTNDSPFILSAHSGGGSLLFGYVTAVTNLPAELVAMAFLDATYGYDSELHSNKFVCWLASPQRPRLAVIAYEDYVATFEGKPFVSATGGTWGKSHLMLEDFRRSFTFTSRTNEFMQTHLAAGGQLEFYLRENPERKIWHTILVERNGLIHALLSGTPHSGRGYEYLGPRSYENFISAR